MLVISAYCQENLKSKGVKRPDFLCVPRVQSVQFFLFEQLQNAGEAQMR